MKNSTSPWKFRYRMASVLLLVSGGVLGVSSAASAAPAAASTTVTVDARLASYGVSGSERSTSVVPETVPEQPRQLPEQQSRRISKQLVDAAVKIIKSLPGWWSKFSAGVKKAFSWFNSYVWKPICAIANAIQVFVTGWDIWNWFH